MAGPRSKRKSTGSSAAKKENTESASVEEPVVAMQTEPITTEANGAAAKPTNNAPPTVQQILRDRLTAIANENWSMDVYEKELAGGQGRPQQQRVMLLEYSSYLENYLWPYFEPKSASFAHLMSILLIINEKFRENVSVWEIFQEDSDKFEKLIIELLKLNHGKDGRSLTNSERISYVIFLINCFQSLEQDMVNKIFLRLVSLPVWKRLSPARLEYELDQYPALRKHWQQMEAKERKTDADQAKETQPTKKRKTASSATPSAATKEHTGPGELLDFQRNFVADLVDHFLSTVVAIPESLEEEIDAGTLSYVERFLELLIDLLSQLPTRRFLRSLFLDMQVFVICKLSNLPNRPEGKLFAQLLNMFHFYEGFEINDQTGMPLTEMDMSENHYSKVTSLQHMVFKELGGAGGPLKDFAMQSVGSISNRESLSIHFANLSVQDLEVLCNRLSLNAKSPHVDPAKVKQFLLEILISSHEKRVSQMDAINDLPLYPSEELLWDENLIPFGQYDGDKVLALPKLNLQFLTFYDYLLRSFQLFRLESAYEIREDIVDAVRRVDPTLDDEDRTIFKGWARMAIPVDRFSITEVKRPLIGEKNPARVKCEVKYDLRRADRHVRSEWDEFRLHDVVFLLTIRAPAVRPPSQSRSDDVEDSTFPERYGIVGVRGAEIVELLDEEGVLMNDPSGRPDARPSGPAGSMRTIKALLDPAQYQKDMSAASDVYEEINLLVRRKSKENNFKAVLETIRDLMNATAINKAVPTWLHDVFLGYGNPGAAFYKNLPKQINSIDFKDTFVSQQHVLDTFPERQVKFVSEDGEELNSALPPYKITFQKPNPRAPAEEETLTVTPYTLPSRGPYPENRPKMNQVPFTPTQAEAIRAGVNHGLTMVVGPPGTGKTDVAVQIISNLYHNFPNQRILLVTHSNQALNDLFSKLMERDIQERHMLRLGGGHKELNAAGDFSKWGRVQFTLRRRLELLGQVQKLATSLNVAGDVGYTCETASYFNLHHIISRTERFEIKIEEAKEEPSQPDAKLVGELFPFSEYFADAPQPLFKQKSFDEDYEIAQSCFRYLNTLFEELEDYRAFEVLRTHAQRGDYLLTKQARIVAMTCTHAALARRNFVELGLKYDSIVMEESAQILEIETFIPMMLQNIDDVEGCRLKRVVLIGDHHQLPPVVKNLAFQKYGRLDQSLFARFVRLGVPTIQLNLQGRARGSIARLYNWRYDNLGDLPAVRQREYLVANSSFLHEYQFINVEDYEGKGEFQPTPYFYQNLGEAEYAVALFQYMRLMGYPAAKITILTTYNGQKHLIRDVLKYRCGHPFYGQPDKITTVDRYQGQQNDYVILSLVRTKAVGHFRDIRRLVVAMSRARLGLYVLGRQRLFENCFELARSLSILLERPNKLMLLPEDRYPTSRKVNEARGKPVEIADITAMGKFVHDVATRVLSR